MVNMVNPGGCCGDLFKEFKFQDFSPKIDIPKRKEEVDAKGNKKWVKGVYVIRVKGKGEDPNIILERFYKLISGNTIEPFLEEEIIPKEIKRIEKTGSCPIIYIGGGRLWFRYHRGIFGSGNHGTRFPVWLLLFFGWELQIGWICTDDYKSKEKCLIKDYKGLDLHGDKLPALNKQG